MFNNNLRYNGLIVTRSPLVILAPPNISHISNLLFRPGEIFSKLKMAAILYFEAKTDKWVLTSDLAYMNLNQEVTPQCYGLDLISDKRQMLKI
jgi:hypothetical protein